MTREVLATITEAPCGCGCGALVPIRATWDEGASHLRRVGRTGPQGEVYVDHAHGQRAGYRRRRSAAEAAE